MANFPSKPANPISARAFLKATRDKTPQERDAIAADLVINGNFPSFIRKFVPIDSSKNGKVLEYKVSPDFLCIGTDSDYMIWPFSAPQCQRIAAAFGCMIPTVQMSEEIYKKAKVKLDAKTPSMLPTKINGQTYSPKDFVASKHMISPQGVAVHNKMIRDQLKDFDYIPGELVAGHKKDVVIDQSVPEGRLGMHGLYDKGKAIQGGALTSHTANHIEYGMALRLVDRKALLDGRPVDLLKFSGVTQSYSYKESAPDTQADETSPSELRPMSNYPSDPTTGAPKGYHAFSKGEKVTPAVSQAAIQIRDKFINMPFGTVVPFEAEGKYWMARVERHSNKPRGITVYKKNDDSLLKQKPNVPHQKNESDSLNAIYRYFEQASKDMGDIV